MVSKRVSLPFLLIVVASVAACVPPESETEDSFTLQQEIKGGVSDNDGHPAVVGLALAGGALCTGTLIAPNLVLTAHHCVAPTYNDTRGVQCGRTSFGNNFVNNAIFVTTDPYIQYSDLAYAYRNRKPPGFYGVTEVFAAGGNGGDFCGNDLAMLILDSNVPDTVATPIVPRIDIPVYTGENYSAIGFGVTGIVCSSDADCPRGVYCEPQSGQCSDSGLRRIKENNSIQCNGSTDCPPGYGVDRAEFVGTAGTCSGDSGGPAIDRKGRVLGALSRGPEVCQSPLYTAVEQWADVVMEYGLKAAEQGGYEPPFWAVHGVSEVPENDPDFDGVFTGTDNCPNDANEDQADADNDGQGDVCDANSDADSIGDDVDNCPYAANEDQLDTDGDTLGDACDDDDDDDGVPDEADACPTNAKFANFGSDCSITGDDLIIVPAVDKGCSTAGGAPSSLAGLLLMLGLFWRPRRRIR